MIYLTYAAIFGLFGVSMFWLRLVTVVVVLTTAVAIYEVGKLIFGEKRALWATLIFGFLTSLRLIEGNLALTEIWMILPTSFAFFLVILRKFDYLSLFAAGILIAFASLYKQVGALEAVALGIFLFLSSRSLVDFVKGGALLTLGFTIPYAITVAYFAPKNLLGEYIFAAYTYYRIYLGESPKYALLINILKFLPLIAAVGYGIFKKARGEVNLFHLTLLWTAFSFLGSYFSGRTYGHYLVQAIPAISLLLASIDLKPRLTVAQSVFALAFFIPLIFLTKLLFTDFLSGGPINQVKYWQNFIEFAARKKGVNDYNDYFDGNVNSIAGLADFLRERGAVGQAVYIWGDYPWLYAIADSRNPVRYVTSFHVFGVPEGKKEVIEALGKTPPRYIILPPTSIGYFAELEKLLEEKYTLVTQVENSKIWQLGK